MTTSGPGITRRELLGGIGIGAGALALAPSVFSEEAASAQTYVKGADVSWLSQMEANGFYHYNSDGEQQDLLELLKGYGINAVRLRTWLNPSDDPSNGHCRIEETAEMAARADAAGLPANIDFHFGDTWNSAGVQNPPAEWADMSYEQMLDAMYDYVYHSMNVISTNGVTPGWVQIGNETNSGICHPVGSVSDPAQMTGLLDAAYDMVKEVFPAVPVLVHLAQPQHTDVIYTFLDRYTDNGGQWDITGLSSYAAGENVAPILSAMQAIQDRYGKPVMHVEFGGQWDRAEDTRDDLAAFVSGVKAFGGLGTFYWEPEVYGAFNTYSMGAWDWDTRRPTVALDGFVEA